MRLIDADELGKVISANHYLLSAKNNSVNYGMFTTGIMQAIDNAPTVEERPTGEWEEPFEWNGKTYHKCTNCHISSQLILINNYCPYCGAKMKGGRKNEVN